MNIAATIKELLAQKQKSIRWLSEETGISINTLYSVTKRNSCSMKDSHINAIAKALEVPREVLESESIIHQKKLDKMISCISDLSIQKYSLKSLNADSILICDLTNKDSHILIDYENLEKIYEQLQQITNKMIRQLLKDN